MGINAEATGLLKKEYNSALKRAGRIWNIMQITSFFNYINYVADALGVPLEDFMDSCPREESHWGQF